MPDTALPSSPNPQGLLTVDLPVDGIHCAGCVSRIERALLALDGVADAAVNLATGEARVSFDGSAVSTATLRHAIEEVGYQVPSGITEVSIQGMHCAACVTRVERALARVPGVLEAEVGQVRHLAEAAGDTGRREGPPQLLGVHRVQGLELASHRDLVRVGD